MHSFKMRCKSNLSNFAISFSKIRRAHALHTRISVIFVGGTKHDWETASFKIRVGGACVYWFIRNVTQQLVESKSVVIFAKTFIKIFIL